MTTPEDAPAPAPDTAAAPAPDEPTEQAAPDEAQRETEQTVRSISRLEEQN